MSARAILPLLLALGCSGGGAIAPAPEPVAGPEPLLGVVTREHDPSPVLGRWVTTLRLASGEVQTFEADLTPAGGVFLGRFEFFRLGQLWQIQFADADWDGVRLQFTAQAPVGGIPTDIQWMAVFFPAAGGEPPRLRLSSDVTGGPEVAVEYVRP